jgi:hypothetical protein
MSNKKFYEDYGLLNFIYCGFCNKPKHCEYSADGEPICDKCLEEPIEHFDDERLSLAERNA